MKVRRNRWLSRIRKSVGEFDDEKAVQILVDRFRFQNETLETITRQLGVSKILREPLPFDGGVYEVEGMRLVKLNSLAPPVRQKFTLAHEIAHLILERTLKATATCTDDQQLERACDFVASELLIPAETAHKVARELGPQSPEKLTTLANHFEVSLETAAKRMYDLGLWKLSVGMWKYGPTSEQVWFVGKRPWNTDRPSFAAFELAVESKTPVCTRERFAKGLSTDLVALKAHHIGKNFVVAVVATTGKDRNRGARGHS